MPDNDLFFLYVEDDAFSRTVMHTLIVRQMGYPNLVIFEDSSNFIERVETLPRKPDIIFLDIHVAPYDGFDMLKMLRSHQDYQQAIVVALTASVMSEEVDLLKQAGFDGVFAKPLDIDVFPQRIERLLSGEQIWEIT